MQVFTVKNTYHLYVIDGEIHYFLSYVSGETCDWHQVFWIGNKNETFYKEQGGEDFGFGDSKNYGYIENYLLKECNDTDDTEDAIGAVDAFKEKMKKFDDLLKLKVISF